MAPRCKLQIPIYLNCNRCLSKLKQSQRDQTDAKKILKDSSGLALLEEIPLLLREAVGEAFSGAPTSAGLSISESICNGFDVPRTAAPSAGHRPPGPKGLRRVQAVRSIGQTVPDRGIVRSAGGARAPVATLGVGTGVRLG